MGNLINIIIFAIWMNLILFEFFDEFMEKLNKFRNQRIRHQGRKRDKNS